MYVYAFVRVCMYVYIYIIFNQWPPFLNVKKKLFHTYKIYFIREEI